MALPLTSTDAQIIRLTTGLFNLEPGYVYLSDFQSFVEDNDINAFADALIAYLGNPDNQTLAEIIADNLGLSGDAATGAVDYLVAQYNANPNQRGMVTSQSLDLFSTLAETTDPVLAIYSDAASQFNIAVGASLVYSSNPNNVTVNDPAGGTHFNLEPLSAAGADVMRITGDQVVRIDFTNPANQVTGQDLNGDGIIQSDGVENRITGVAADFEIVDAYARNPWDHTDNENNYLGDIHFDGTGFDGDGVNTDGNIFLGGLGVDTAFGGIGNDFLAGGEVAQGRVGSDYLSGGRNADFFFTSLSLLSPTDGDNLYIDGGTTSDDAAPDGQPSPQDADWLLFEASDDDEPVTINLSENNANPDDAQQYVMTRSGVSVRMDDVENIDASGNLYGFLNDINVTIGELAGEEHTVGEENTAIGASAQLDITGSVDRNIIIGGYDNDVIRGDAGNDILFGGNLDYNNNPNLQGIVNDGMDFLYGGSGADDIIFEADGGTVDGGANGAVLASTGAAAATVTADFNALVGIGSVIFDTAGTGSYAVILRSSNGGSAGFTITASTDEADAAKQLAEAIGSSAKAKGEAVTIDLDKFRDDYGFVADDASTLDVQVDIDQALAGNDTLWLTHLAFGTGDASMTTDGKVRIDLASDIDSNGYGGADRDGTEDETNWADGSFVTVTGFENVIASGLGRADYAAAGTNDPDLSFHNLINRVDAIDAMLDLRGDNGDNTLYGAEQDDVIEGRDGNDSLSGRGGNDDFIFELGFNDGNANAADADDGDGVDVIHRQDDNDVDGLWDGTFSRDFGLDQSSTADSSSLVIDVANTDTSLEIGLITFFVDGTEYVVGPDVLLAGGNMGEIVDLLDAELQEQNPLLSAALGAGTAAEDFAGQFIITAQAEEGATQPPRFVESGDVFDPDSVGVFINTSDSEAASTSEEVVGGVAVSEDRIIYQSYEDRLDGERTDDDSITGSNISLGLDSYAEDLVIHFADEDGDGEATTRIAEDQNYILTFNNLTTEDIVTITVNDVIYELQVGVDLDGNNIAGEDTNSGITQAAIQDAFLTRMAGYINSFMDDDTSAGSVGAGTNDGFATTLVLTQNAYNGEETVFMVHPTVDIQNLSKGEAATVTVTNNASHEVEILDFDGRNNALNSGNVLFWGSEETNRAVLETAADAGSDIIGSNVIMIDDGDNDLQVPIWDVDGNETGDIVFNNTATNSTHEDDNFSVHGDDFLLGGDGNDTILGGTGDDRVQGSRGDDEVDGGKNLYAVKVLGEDQSRVYELNVWEAANFSIAGKAITSITLLSQSETGVALASGLFDDTLIFEQADFEAGVTEFTVTLNNYNMNGDVVELQNDGAGTVDVDEDADGVIDHTTVFTNFENVRTASGVGHAVADDGQGNDTLVIDELSRDTGGVSYDLTNSGTAGRVSYSQDVFVNHQALDAGTTESEDNSATVTSVRNAIVNYIAADTLEQPSQAFINAVNAIPTTDITISEFLAAVEALAVLDRPTSANDGPANITDYESLIMRVDGVENVVSGEGNDLVIIDETEAAKNNSFEAGLGTDRIEYQNDFQGGDDEGIQPTITINVNTDTDTDTVVSTAGRLGLVEATDTLESVEYITLAGETATSTREDDVLNVTAMTTGAVVDYTNGEVRDLDGDVQVVIEGIAELENVHADGDDVVIVANDLSVLNSREDTVNTNDNAPEDLQLQTFFDYDDDMTGGNFTIDGVTARTSFIAKNSNDITDVVNQNQFTFSMSETGGGNDTDRIDYSAETGEIISIVDFNDSNDDHFIIVDGDSDGDLTDANSRVDHLRGVEEVVASAGDSVIDLTNFGQAINLRYQKIDSGTAASTNVADADTVAVELFFEDQSNSTPFGDFTYIEYYDDPETTDETGEIALWNQIEGSDANEYIELTSDQLDTRHIFNLRGGDNEVNYNEQQSRGIILTVDSIDNGITALDILGTDNAGVANAANTSDKVTSYNNVADIEGSLRIEASQSQHDTINLQSLTSNQLLVLGEAEGSDDVINIIFDQTGDQVGLVLTGFENMTDSAGDDVYQIEDLTNFLNTLTLTDTAGDSDTVKLLDGALESFGVVDWSDDSIELEDLETEIGFDFDTLDISSLTEATDLVSTGDAEETVILGNLNLIGDQGDAFVDVQTFETIVFTTLAGVSKDLVIDIDNREFRESDGTILFTFDSATTFDFSAVEDDVEITVEDTAPVGVTVITDPTDVITTADGDDVLEGGAGADTLDGGTIAEVLETLTFDFNGGLVSTQADATAYIELSDGTGAIRFYNDGTVEGDATGAFGGGETDLTASYTGISPAAGADAVGAAIEELTTADLQLYLPDFAIQSISYDEVGVGGQLLVTYATGVDPVPADITLEHVEGVAADSTLEANATSLVGAPVNSAQGDQNTAGSDSADIFIYRNASDFGDTIKNFDASDLIVIDSSVISSVSITDKGDALTNNFAFTAAEKENFFNSKTIAVGSDRTDGRIWIDTDGDNDLTNSDAVLIMDGETTADDFDANFEVAALGLTSTSRNVIVGTAGNDGALNGSAITNLDELILGLAGDDVIDGNGGHDTIAGGAGNDTINGDIGNDTIDGGDGNDSITGGTGVDTLTGGAGTDTFVFGGNNTTEQDSILDFAAGVDSIDATINGGGTITYVNAQTADAGNPVTLQDILDILGTGSRTIATGTDATQFYNVDADGDGNTDDSVILTDNVTSGTWDEAIFVIGVTANITGDIV